MNNNPGAQPQPSLSQIPTNQKPPMTTPKTTIVTHVPIPVIFRPALTETKKKQEILVSPGHKTPLGWLTHIATLLDPRDESNPTAAFNNPANDALFCYLLTHPRLIGLCKDAGRVWWRAEWSAGDEALSDDETFGRNNKFRERAVAEVLEEVKQGRGGVDLKARGFDERSTWNLRVLEVKGPFQIRVDRRGHESVVEVEDKRIVQMM